MEHENSDSGKNLEEENSIELAPKQEKSPLDKYADAFKESVLLRKEFSSKPGYVREKSEQEKAYHQAKKIFGDFTPKDKDSQVANDNNGKGFTVNDPELGDVHLNNQQELFEKVVAFNKKNGQFYDLDKILEKSPTDHARLLASNEMLSQAKKSVPVEDLQKLPELQRQTRKLVDDQGLESTKTKLSQGHSTDEKLSSEKGDKLDQKKPKLSNDELSDKPALSAFAINPDKVRPYSEEIDETYSSKQNLLNKTVVYSWKDSGKVAFRDKGDKITTREVDPEVVKSIVEMADSKGWESIKVSGKGKFKQAVWLEAQMKGIEVKGYRPSEHDKKLLERKLNTVEEDKEKIKDKPVATDKRPKPTEKQVSDTKAKSIDKDKTKDSVKVKSLDNVQPIKKSDVLAAQSVHDNKVSDYKEKLSDAMKKMKANDAIKKYPELKDVYQMKKGISAFADNNIQSKVSREKFVNASVGKLLTEVSKGKPLPSLVAKRSSSKSVAKSADIGR
jgi:hypothetical protein